MSATMPLFDKTSCPCFSGLRRVRCCGLDPAGLPDPANHAVLDPLMEKARTARTEGRNREAERHVLQILDLAPHHRDALRLLFELRRAEGRLAAAEALIKRIASLDPPAVLAHVQHAQLLVNQGRHAEAETPARLALQLAPRDPTVNHLLGIIFTETGKLQAGERHYRMALGFADQRDPALIGNLAWNMKQQGRLDEAASLYEAAFALKRDNPRGLAGYAQVQAARLRLDEAEALLAEAAALAPADRMIALLGVLVRLHRDDPADALARIEAVAASIAPQSLVATEFAAKGQALERLGRFDDAFAAYQAARTFQRERAGRQFDPAPIEARLAQVKTTFISDRLSALPRPAPIAGAPAPVFLLGTPRSGTSLLEQMLIQMPGIDPADTRGPLPDLARLLPALIAGLGGPEKKFPEALVETTAGEQRDALPMLAQRYLATLRGSATIGADSRFVTDRGAELPWLIGFAAALFPDAPVIHVLRHPLDVVLSGFAQDKLYEGNAGVTLASLARLYDAQMQAIAQVRGQTTLRYLPIRYEDMVRDPAAALGQVLDFLAVAADPATLLAAPPRAVPRAPAHRVLQQKPHRRGLYRHRGFGAVFDEAMPILAPWIERLGYAAPERIAA
ncbi:sulfotransferase [Acidiphilium sp. AL]|uniref:tetratricopeptide repeat-containing sulfotransferase family protein n=1 Tax=Acidiphilium sp. AL TaxID=2871704 RepID=UPI0021CB301B|nr:tetratricopeptide repeat-containing sulfotransferase family protein [Acidiphilium sp. AL]MCU4159201.1 sulfotransferase [Acidiphilium sp. AL]